MLRCRRLSIIHPIQALSRNSRVLSGMYIQCFWGQLSVLLCSAHSLISVFCLFFVSEIYCFICFGPLPIRRGSGPSDLASVHRSGGLVFHIFHIVSDISSDKWWPHQHPPPLLVHLSKPHESEMTLNNYASPRDQVPLPSAWIPFKSLRQINQLEASSICWLPFFLAFAVFCTSSLTSFF